MSSVNSFGSDYNPFVNDSQHILMQKQFSFYDFLCLFKTRGISKFALGHCLKKYTLKNKTLNTIMLLFCGVVVYKFFAGVIREDLRGKSTHWLLREEKTIYSDWRIERIAMSFWFLKSKTRSSFFAQPFVCFEQNRAGQFLTLYL